MNAVPTKIDKLLGRGDLLRELDDDVRPWIRVSPALELVWICVDAHTRCQIESNRGMVLHSFKYPNVAKRLHELGLRDSTAYACLLPYMIRPKPPVQAFINQYASFFALPSVFSIGVQIRTGDYSMVSACLVVHVEV